MIAMKLLSFTRVTSLLLAAWVMEAPAAPDLRVGFLASTSSPDRLGPEGQAAGRLAQKLAAAPLILPAGEGQFVDQNGQEVALDRFAVLWHHEGDSIEQTGPLYDPASLEALRRYVSDGHGLFLSGAALAMVETLRVETIHPRRGGPGTDGNPADLIPVATKHPIFRGLSAGGNIVPISDAGYPAFADFHASGGPAQGMLLARTPGGSENPLVEYELGQGRIIAMGWRLPHYSHAANVHRANLERLTENILRYLGDPAQWQKVVVKPYRWPPTAEPEPGVPDGEWRALELAIQDLSETFPDRYPEGAAYLKRLTALKKAHDELVGRLPTAADEIDGATEAHLEKIAEQFGQLRSEALLANPLLNFDRLLVIKRSVNSPGLGLPANWQGNSSLPQTGYDNAIAVLSPLRPDGLLTTLFQPDGGQFVGDVDLHFDADRMLFSMPGPNGRWQVFEIRADGTGLRQVTPGDQPDVDNYDACYLPDGRIVFTSTACMQGVPCVGGADHVANLYLLSADGQTVRQLCFDQDHDWCPTVLNNGRLLYTRWEYCDIPHAFSRLLFHCNPDGTEQMEYYGSNSYWPNSIFYARPIPNHPTQVVGIVTGHHGVARIGELVIFDPARGHREADGVVQRIPGYGEKVEPILLDQLVDNSWPKFLHPYPLSEKYFLVAAQPNPASLWGIYLVDVFDNLLLLREEPGYALLEPIPFRPTPKPPVIVDRVDLRRTDATVFMVDVYAGDGLQGVPRGTIKQLRLFTYHYAYHGLGGQPNRVGLDGPWDVKRIIGTVPVYEDGSAQFRVPANTPISVQPLDAEGKAVQLMRSWFTARPGEVVSCVGCHEPPNAAPPTSHVIAATRPPSDIKPWYGPTRGFSFKREVQPVLDRYCVSCHHGEPWPDGRTIPDLRDQPPIDVHPIPDPHGQGKFTPSYYALRRFVRSPTIESDLHLLPPWEFHADSTRLVQLLRKGHHHVQLDAEAWDRLITWIDLGAPAHGTWHEIVGMDRVAHHRDRRRELRKLYAGMDEDPEAIPEVADFRLPIADFPDSRPRNPQIANRKSQIANPGGPMAEIANRKSQIANPGGPMAEIANRKSQIANLERTIDLGEGVTLELVRIPAGEFVLGDANGHPDEQPPSRVRIDRPFWMGKFEVTNEQYHRFDPRHDSRLEHGHFLQFSVRERGYPLNGPRQPVVRISWTRALAFCRWLSEKTGETFTLPTEAQWEYACRAGTTTPLSYGDIDTDHARFANLADATLKEVEKLGWNLPYAAIPPWHPTDGRFHDGARVSADVGSYEPNAWGLHDLHGNVAEWTRTTYRPYPYREDDGRNNGSDSDRKVVRGGSWYDRPQEARSAYRLSYPAYQSVYDVGFRVILTAR